MQQRKNGFGTKGDWSKVVDSGKRLGGDFLDTTKKAFDNLWKRVQKWMKDQESRTSLFFADDLDELQKSDNPLVTMESRNVPSHVVQAMVYLSAGAGVFQSADEISRFTRDLMDHDQAAVQQWLRRVFDPEQAKEISVWMDTAPGAEYAGGWAHRLTHGHDSAALVELTGEHGFIGAAEWANHVWLRDFWTPHGVPYLPAGSGTVYEWLIDSGLSPSTAMGLLTVNAAEVASGVLIYMSGKRISKAWLSFITARRYRKDLEQVIQLAREGSEAEAIRRVGEIETFSETKGAAHLRLHLATFCLDHALRPESPKSAAWGERSFSIARDLCKSTKDYPREVDYLGGTRVSFAGLAATVMIASVSSQVQLRQIDLQHLSDQIDFGIRQYLQVATSQTKDTPLKIKGFSVLSWRPYSALTNLTLALELATICGSLHQTGVEPLAIRTRMIEITERLNQEDGQHKIFAEGLRGNIERVYPVAA